MIHGMGEAVPIIRERHLFDDGAILEIRIWRLSGSVPPSEHCFKYSLFYGRPGQRLVGYDNERGKGDHKHLDDVEHPYCFVSIERLLTDFKADVEAVRGGPI